MYAVSAYVKVGCPSVCLSRQSIAAATCGGRSGAGDRYQSIAAGVRAAVVGSVML